MVEDFLWRYVEKYHQQDLDKLRGLGVKHTYHGNLSRLELESISGSSVRDASEHITRLCQKLAADIFETTFKFPNGADQLAFVELGHRFAENARAIFYIDGRHVCHVIGPKDRLASVVREIQDAWKSDQYATIGQTTTPKTSGYRMTTHNGVNVEIYTGNLLQDNVDAVVNPANIHLSHGGGAAKAIADAAGPQLQRECREYTKRYGQLKFTQVMHTTAGNMYPPVRFVIHAAGPPADQYRGNSAALRQAVFDTFFNCLRYANEHLHVRSMSIPAISSGIFGVPKRMVAVAAYDALMKFDDHLQLGLQRHLQRINYVNLDTETTDLFTQAFSGSASRDRDWRAGGSRDRVRGARRSGSTERQPAKQAYLQSAWQDAGDDTESRQRRTSRDNYMRLPTLTVAQPRSDVAVNHTTVARTTRRTAYQASAPDSRRTGASHSRHVQHQHQTSANVNGKTVRQDTQV